MSDLFTGIGYYKLRAQNITFLNEFAKNMFVADGLVDEFISNCYFTGNPAFDKILSLQWEKSPTWIANNFIEAGKKKLVLHADMPAYWHPVKKASHNKTEAEIIEEVEVCYDAAMQNGAFYLLRPHPSQDRNLYSKLLKGKSNAMLAAEHNLHELLKNIDLLVCRTTTVGLEAAIMKKRILQLSPSLHMDLPLADMGIAWGADNYSGLTKQMQSALNDDKKYEEIKVRTAKMLPAEPAAPKIAGLITGKIYG